MARAKWHLPDSAPGDSVRQSSREVMSIDLMRKVTEKSGVPDRSQRPGDAAVGHVRCYSQMFAEATRDGSLAVR